MLLPLVLSNAEQQELVKQRKEGLLVAGKEEMGTDRQCTADSGDRCTVISLKPQKHTPPALRVPCFSSPGASRKCAFIVGQALGCGHTSVFHCDQ